MISDEVKMLGNRMRSHPEEFTAGTIEFGDRYMVRESRKWDSFMNSLVNDKPDLDTLFTAEEIKYLKGIAKEILRPMALATIVKTIVGGEDYSQMELDFIAKKRVKLSASQVMHAKSMGMTPAEYAKEITK
jgi:hypothetical protein